MSDEGRTPGEANETITLEGNERLMRPSIEMALHFSRGPGGIHGATMRCINLDMDTIVEVVRMSVPGLQSTDPKMLKRVQREVYAIGLREVGTKCCAILAALANGGRKSNNEPNESNGEGDDPLPEAASG